MFVSFFAAMHGFRATGCPWEQQHFSNLRILNTNPQVVEVEFDCSDKANLRIGHQLVLSSWPKQGWVVTSSSFAELPDPCSAGSKPRFRLNATDIQTTPAINDYFASDPDGLALCVGISAPARASLRRLQTTFSMRMAELLDAKPAKLASKNQLPRPKALTEREPVACDSNTCFGPRLSTALTSFDVIAKDGFDMGQIRLCTGGTKSEPTSKCSYNSLTPPAQGRLELLFEDVESGYLEPEWGTVCLASKSSIMTTGDNAWPVVATSMAKVV